MPVLPATWRTLRSRRPYEWMLVSSHLFAHHARLGGDRQVPKYSYVHTPARYIWDPAVDARGRRPLVRAASRVLQPIDRRRAQESVRMAANSEYTRRRIRSAWDRDADVIHPPVDTETIIAGGDWRERLGAEELRIREGLPDDFLLGASRFVGYKRLDRVIEAGEATGMPVVLAGDGPEHRALLGRAERATIPVVFVLAPSDALLFALYQAARAYVFPAVEDFGIMPVEAMACGTPVIVSAEGGAIEGVTLADGGTSVAEPTTSGWRRAVDAADGVDRIGLPARASRFSDARFRREIAAWMSTP
ncbi:glycosyltransferase family 4 protein [Schumannella luteola]|nr:glycosyltransferase family 4 protein [Schumannella luteola]